MGDISLTRSFSVDGTAKDIAQSYLGKAENAYQATYTLTTTTSDIIDSSTNPAKIILLVIVNTGAVDAIIRFNSTNSSGIVIPPGRAMVRFGQGSGNNLSTNDWIEVGGRSASTTTTIEVLAAW